MLKIKTKLILLLALCLISGSFSLAEFRPDEVAIIANSKDPSSLEIAEFYANLRKIPKENIIYIQTSNNYNIDRNDFEKEILNPIRVSLSSNQLKKIKVLATTYGVPIKINDLGSGTQNTNIKIKLNEILEATLVDFKKACEEIDQVSEEFKISAQKLSNRSDIRPQEILNLLDNLWKKAEANKDLDKNKKELVRSLITKTIGHINPIIQFVDEKIAKKIKVAKESTDKINLHNSEFSEKDLESLTRASELLFGITGKISMTKSIYDRLFGEHTAASVDSELSLTLIPNTAPISSRIPNPLFIDHDKSLLITDPILLVSRLDGPNVDSVKNNIVSAIKIENQGKFEGNFLIDSRGSSFDDRSEIASWDRKLTTLARNSFGENITVEFDQSQDLAEDIKNIALYLGWYSLRNYKDSYSFSKGAVGYHIASEEAVNLHDPQEKGWCKNLLERGVVTTVGAVEEPYLDSFPHPEYFFPLILTGKYQMVEIYYMTSKYLSWRLVLFSDPLYNPYKNNKNAQSLDDLSFKPKPPISTRLSGRN